MSTSETKLGAREISKSREFVTGRLQTLPEMYSRYQKMTKRANDAKEDGDQESYDLLNHGALGIYHSFNEQRTEVIARISEVLYELSKDAKNFETLMTPLLPLFKTQQEMVTEKQK